MPGVAERTMNLDFSGGLNTVDPPTELADNELVECNNFFVGDGGQLTKRFGFMKLGEIGLDLGILGMDYGGTRLVMADPSTVAGLWRITYSPTYSSVQYTSLPAGEVPRWQFWVNNRSYFGFVGTPGIRSTATTVMGANYANSPASTFAAYHKNRVFTNVYNVPGRLFFSDPLDPTVGDFTWQTTNFIPIDITNTEEISAIVPLGDLLLIFKWSSVWALYVQGNSPADWNLRRISDRLGCAPAVYGHRSSLVYNNEAYFMDKHRGVFKTNGSSFVELSRKVWKSPEGIFGLSGAGSYRSMAIWKNYLIVTIRDYLITLEPTKIMLVLNLNTGAWSNWTFLNTVFNDMAVVPSSITDPSASYWIGVFNDDIYITSPELEPTYFDEFQALGLNSYADGFAYGAVGTGAAYTSTFQTKEFTTGVDELLRSKWMGLEYTAYGSPTFKSVIDGTVGAAQTPGFHATLRKGYKVNGGGRGRTLALRGEHALTSPYEFYRASMHLTSKVPIKASGAP